MKKAITATSFVLLLGVAGCYHTQPLGVDYGNATNHNMSMHIINPAPSYEGREIPDFEGTRASGAIERYDTGGVIAPEAIDTGDGN